MTIGRNGDLSGIFKRSTYNEDYSENEEGIQTDTYVFEKNESEFEEPVNEFIPEISEPVKKEHSKAISPKNKDNSLKYSKTSKLSDWENDQFEDIKIGMKVIPFKKTQGQATFKESMEKANKIKQKYLYVTELDSINKKVGLWHEKTSSRDWFDSSDFELFEECKQNIIKSETFTYESMPFIINFKVTDKNKNVTYQSVDTENLSYKVIINGTTTIVILFCQTSIILSLYKLK
jgi:hypothetical protein